LDRFVEYVPSENFHAKQADFKSKSDRFLNQFEILIQDINVNIEFINKWINGVDAVSKNADRIPTEYLTNQTTRNIFKYGVDNLKQAAEQFISQSE